MNNIKKGSKKIPGEQRISEAESSESLLIGGWQVLFVVILAALMIHHFITFLIINNAKDL